LLLFENITFKKKLWNRLYLRKEREVEKENDIKDT